MPYLVIVDTQVVNRVLTLLLTRRGTASNVLAQGYEKVHTEITRF